MFRTVVPTPLIHVICSCVRVLTLSVFTQFACSSALSSKSWSSMSNFIYLCAWFKPCTHGFDFAIRCLPRWQWNLIARRRQVLHHSYQEAMVATVVWEQWLQALLVVGCLSYAAMSMDSDSDDSHTTKSTNTALAMVKLWVIYHGVKVASCKLCGALSTDEVPGNLSCVSCPFVSSTCSGQLFLHRLFIQFVHVFHCCQPIFVPLLSSNVCSIIVIHRCHPTCVPDNCSNTDYSSNLSMCSIVVIQREFHCCHPTCVPLLSFFLVIQFVFQVDR